MRDKKKGESEKTAEQEALERHVDAMMDPKLPDASEGPASAEAVSEADVVQTAPQLPAKLRKRIAASDTAAKPISIDELDDLAATITGSKAPAKSKKPAEQPIEDSEPSEAAEPSEADTEGDIAEPDVELDDARTDEAVDDIVSHEGDVMLAIEDATLAERGRQAEAAAGSSGKGGGLSAFLWFLVVVIAVIAIAFFVLLITGGNLPGLKSS